VRRDRGRALLAALGVLAATVLVVAVPATSAQARPHHPLSPQDRPHALRLQQDAGAQTFRRDDVNRVFFGADGTTTPAFADHPHGYDVRMQVSTTSNLRSDQQITVTWSGAHPTGGLVSDINYGLHGAEQEYPFVLMECRGTAATITPETCWTQTSSERTQLADSVAARPVWRADGYETGADRGTAVGAPPAGQRPASCPVRRYERWVPTKAESGATYYGGPSGCLTRAPEASEEDGGGVPNNTTYGITGTDGSGSAQFAVWTAEDNATLGCSVKVSCSLVAVPVIGISCDGYWSQDKGDPAAPTSAQQAQYQSGCESADVYAPGQISNGVTFNEATSGQLWWSASNWRNRIVVPLHFAVAADSCSVVGGTAPLLGYGSILMDEVSAQWQPEFCARKGLQPFLHVDSTDAEARTLVQSGSIKLGFSSRPPQGGFTSPVVQAPVAMTGFAIAYNIDGADGQPYDRLRLDGRLLAKLLTESYQGESATLTPNPDLAGNPATIFADPEFWALNPGISHSINGVGNAAAALIALSSDSDMTYALSQYIAADPEAVRWLQGSPDPWGMRVNPHYEIDLPASDTSVAQHFTLPTDSWPLLDGFELGSAALVNLPCLKGMPYFGQIAHPVSLISTVEQDVEFALSNSQTSCPVSDPNDPAYFVPKTAGRQSIGKRFVLGIVPLTAVDRYGLRAAALQTTSSVGTRTQFTTAAGRQFVAPDKAGLQAAAALLTPDTTDGAWELPYDKLATTSGSTAYPGFMPVYADVPVSGLDKSDAARAAALLRYAAGPGQVAGGDVGQLPAGALPMTAANGFKDQVAYTLCAATQVAGQTGKLPSLTGASCAKAAPPPTTPPGGGGHTTTSGGGSGVVGSSSPPSSQPSTPAGNGTPPVVEASGVTTVGAYSPLGRFGLPVALILALWLGLAGVALRWGEPIVQGARVAVPASRRLATAAFRRVRPPRTAGRRRNDIEGDQG
jgi:hypothetical protein